MDSTILNQWEQISEIPKEVQRKYHSMVSYQNVLYIFGGEYTNCLGHMKYCNDLICFDINKQSWSEVVSTGQIPNPRSLHSATIYNSSMFVFGGFIMPSYDTNTLFEYEFSTKKWKEGKRLDNLFIRLFNHGAVVYNDRLWIFMGVQSADIWNISLLSGNNQQWRKIKQIGDCPTEIYKFSVTIARQWMFVTGQRNGKTSLFRFTFGEGKWFWFKDLVKLNYGSKLVAYEDQLFIFTEQDLYSLNLNTETLSVINTQLNIQIDSFHGHTAVTEDDVYILCNCGKLFKFHLPPKDFKVSTLSTDFKNVLERKLLCDVEFLIGKEEVKFPVHIPILVARSQWFRDRICPLRDLNFKTQDSSLVQVKLPKVNPDIFKVILNYIYTDQIELSKDLLLILDLYELSRDFKLERLQQYITQQLNESKLKDFINRSNVLDVLSKAQLMKLVFIKEFCLNFINEDSNCDEILMSDKFRTLDRILFVEIFRHKQISTNKSSINSQPQSEPTKLRSLEEDMKVFMETFGKEFSDVILILGEDQIPAHKCILAARSNYFEAMFRSFMPPNNCVRIRIGDIFPSKEAFDSLLKYIYYDEIDLSLNHSSQLILAPSFYRFTNNQFLESMKMNLKKFGTDKNMIEVLKAAHEAHEDELKKYVFGLIANRGLKSWPQTTFLPPELYIYLIHRLMNPYNCCNF